MESQTINLADYRTAIEHLAYHKKDKDFYNHGEEHAKIVFENLFKIAEHQIRIFAEDLCSNIPNDKGYINSLETFLKKGSSAKILIEKEPDTTRPIYQLLGKYNDKVSVKITEIRPRYKNVEINFSTVDDHAYRLEVDKNEKLARGNFNDTKFTTMANESFDAMFNDKRSKSISIRT